MKFKIDDALYFVKKMDINMNDKLFTLHDLTKGMNIELEHGEKNSSTNVTHDDLMMTGKIALAHLMEFPDYYKRLDKMESEADEYWQNKSKTKRKIYRLVK